MLVCLEGTGAIFALIRHPGSLPAIGMATFCCFGWPHSVHNARCRTALLCEGTKSGHRWLEYWLLPKEGGKYYSADYCRPNQPGAVTVCYSGRESSAPVGYVLFLTRPYFNSASVLAENCTFMVHSTQIKFVPFYSHIKSVFFFVMLDHC